jgi:protein phosphatase
MEKSYSASYAAAGVDITAGYEGVKLMKKHVQRTMIPGVVSGLGGFGGLFQPELAGMGTTCELVLVRGDTVHVVHVGDSRAYSIRDGKILQITEDHSLVQEMVRRGELTPDQAMRHPNKNLITRALGVAHDVDVDYIEVEFEEGDILLLCSDGLSNFVTKADLVRTVSDNKGDIMIDTLVEIAKRRGGHDNITVTVIY